VVPGRAVPAHSVDRRLHDRRPIGENLRPAGAKIPSEYREKQSFSDFWKSYRPVSEEDPTHERVGKGSGELFHVERFFGLIRQRPARYAR
jgi:hypothetical protein